MRVRVGIGPTSPQTSTSFWARRWSCSRPPASRSWPSATAPKLVIVNRDPTDMDDMADLVLNTEIGPVMGAVAPPD
jgi:hypothetical protein